MSTTDDEPGDRDERGRVIEFWRAVEVFSPQPLPRPDTRLRVTDAGPGEPAPWEPDSPRREPPAPGKAWRHEVFGGVYELSRVRDTLTGLYGPDGDGGQREPAGGQSALFAVTVDGDGVLVPGTAALSSCAWAVGRALAAPGDLSLAGFSHDARLFGGDLGRLAGADAEAAGTLLAPLPGTAPDDEPGRQPGRAVSSAPGEDQEPRPLRGEELRRFAARLGDRLGVAAALGPRGLRARSYQVDADRADEQTAPSFLNSFYADDLTRVAAAAADGKAGAGLTAYLTSGALIDAGRRVDVRARPDAVWHGCLPERIPPGRWPADLDRSLALSQQFAVNEIMARLGAAPGLAAVNGPPGTGKTTLLRDLIAAIVVTRAERLAELATPGEAFDHAARDRWQSGRVRHAVTPLDPALTGLEIVVASSNNGAVENVTAEIPGPAGIGARWQEAAARLDYFTATARLVHGDGAWAMVAARLGNAANRRAFSEKFWWGAPGRQDGCMVDLLGRLAARPVRAADQPVRWDAARDQFRTVRERVRVLAAERTETAQAVLRLADLRRDAAAAYASITAAEETLRALAGQRVAAERSLRAAWHRHGSVMKALDAHALARPGLRASLATRLGARREWRAEQAALENALRDRAAPVAAAQAAIAEVQAQFAAAVRARAEAAATLRRLTVQCAAAQEAIARGRERWDEHFPSDPEFSEFSGGPADAGACRELTSPWADPEFAAARTELFLAALALHKALITAQAQRIRGNLNVLVDFLSGKSRPGDSALLAAWQTLFLVVPVVSTTFASFPAMFGGLGAESIGWLLIDEAGQAPPQQAAGAIWRAKRTVVVGDPMQLEPVVTLPWGGQQALLRLFDVPEGWAPSRTSVQRVADRLACYGTLLPGAGPSEPGPVWVGTPLRVHRRCDRPMFETSNAIAYDGLMVFGTRGRTPFPGRDRWYDVRSGDARGHWIPAEGDQLAALLHELRTDGVEAGRIRVLSPFRQVAAEAAGVHCQVFGETCSADERRKWVGTVHTMQGREADVVILVLGGNPLRPGARAFATRSPNLLNVAVTRARRRLYVIGNRAAWAGEPHFDVLARNLSVG
ncbi:MAG TPA: ATP-binding protein [Trebonia sp.]